MLEELEGRLGEKEARPDRGVAVLVAEDERLRGVGDQRRDVGGIGGVAHAEDDAGLLAEVGR